MSSIQEHIARAEAGLSEVFARIDRMEEAGTRRVLKVFQEHNVAYRHFAPTTGYGYDDVGRDTLERIFADLFGTEAAIVRPQIASGTAIKHNLIYPGTNPGSLINPSAILPKYSTIIAVIIIGAIIFFRCFISAPPLNNLFSLF